MEEPEFLYKYRYFDENGYHLDILRNLELYFASPSELNDPFDCKIPVRWDKLNKSEIEKYLSYTLKISHPHLHPNKIIKKASKMARDFLSKANPLDYLEKLNTLYDDKYGICSFSTERNHNALWSLYSDVHKGFCIVLDKEKLSEHFNLLSWNQLQTHGETATIISGVPVSYEPEIPIFKPVFEKDGILKNAMIPISTKSLDWKHENEFRYFTYSSTNLNVPIPKDSIIKIVAGIKVEPQNLLLLEDICASKNIKLIRALKDPLSFKADY